MKVIQWSDLQTTVKGRKCSGFPDGMNDVAGTEQIIKLLFKHGMDHYLNQHIKFLIVILKLNIFKIS